MKYLQKIAILSFLALVFFACSNLDEPQIEQSNSQNTSTSTTANKNKQDLLIGDAFMGITPGDAISTHDALLSKTVLKTGEADFEAYKITSKLHGEVGYLLPEPKDTKLVGNIFISNPKATTKEGIHVGSTLGDLLQQYPEAVIHGSEIEGRTHAIIGKHFYLLDSRNFTYEIKKGSIPENTKILEIMIQR